MKVLLIGLVLGVGGCGIFARDVESANVEVAVGSGNDMQSHTSTLAEQSYIVEKSLAVEPEVDVENDKEDMEQSSANLEANGISVLEAEKGDEGSSEEDSLSPPLPPSSKARQWGLAVGLIALFSTACLLWIYRHSLPLHHLFLRKIPRVTLGLPTITSSAFSLTSTVKDQFRPAPNLLFQWSEEEDPSNPSPSLYRTRPVLSSSSWRSKIPIFGRRGVSGGSRSRTRLGGLFLGELETATIEEGYEEVGLLPNPSSYPSEGSSNARSRMTSYGSV